MTENKQDLYSIKNSAGLLIAVVTIKFIIGFHSNLKFESGLNLTFIIYQKGLI